jgi:NADH dehydrogenase
MVLVVGATGSVGSEICRRLVGKPTRGLVRRTSDPAKVAGLRKLGVELVEGDLKDRRTLDAACAGADAVISTASATISRQPGDTLQSVDLEGQISLVDAARAAGVKHFICVSAHLHPAIPTPLQEAKAAVERAVRESGMTWTILQPTMFMEIWLSAPAGFDLVHYRAVVQGTGRQKISFISYKDVAAFAVAALDNPRARNATLVLGGPEALSPLRVIMLFEDLTGEKFTLQHIPEEALQQAFAAAPDPMAKTFAGLGLLAARGDVVDMTDVSRDFPDIQLTSVREYARTILGYRRESTGVPD